MIKDDPKFLLFMEPKKEDKLDNPIDDKLTKCIEHALSKASIYATYRGWHTGPNGERSTNHDYELENGLITNSLAPLYVRWYRYSINENDMKKINDLLSFYNL